MIILVDQDGPLAQFEAGVFRQWERLGHSFRGVPVPERVCEWVADDYPQECRDLVRRIYRSDGFYGSLEPVPGSKQALEAMRAAGHTVFICTSPLHGSRTCIPDKMRWMHHHFGPAWVERTIITHDKTLIRGDCLIDDHPQHGVIAPTWEQVLYDMPFNRTMNGMRRVTWGTWQSVLADMRRP